MTFRTALISSLRRAGQYNSEIQAAPCCILWTDEERQWEPVIPSLLASVPELLALGAYEPERRQGPAIWLRCALQQHHEDGKEHIPVLYLPGVSRASLRAVENCPRLLQPLAELQYRGAFWSQDNAKDWTLLAWMTTARRGLNLQVDRANATRQALKDALPILLDKDLQELQGFTLDAEWLNRQILGGDPVREMLQWLNDGDDALKNKGEAHWRSFLRLCREVYRFDPEARGPLEAAAHLQARDSDLWRQTWDRLMEHPSRYGHIPSLLRRAELPEFGLFDPVETKYCWLAWNDREEKRLKEAMETVGDMTDGELKKLIRSEYERHSCRLASPWTAAGKCPWILLLEQLYHLVLATERNCCATNWTSLRNHYGEEGWKADKAALAAMQMACESQELKEPAHTVLRVLYLPWLDTAARQMQKLAAESPYPETIRAALAPFPEECRIFVDGLRYDIAREVAGKLREKGLEVTLSAVYSALPSLTATGKPAVSPVAPQLEGDAEEKDFYPRIQQTGQSLKGGVLNRMLEQARETTSCGWMELGDIDHEGHAKGARLARHLPGIIDELAGDLLRLSRKYPVIRVVTDHGWLLMPGGFPKVELPACLVEGKWGRCALPKESALGGDHPSYPWFWNGQCRFTIAAGVACYRAGMEYCHGGMSLQECIIPVLTVKNTETCRATATDVSIQGIVWKGLRCVIDVEGGDTSMTVDIRRSPAERTASLAVSPKQLAPDQAQKLLIENEDTLGEKAYVVILDRNGNLISQATTHIGEK